jgi:hypothetical protein
MPLEALAELYSGIIVYRVMNTVPPSTTRVRKLRERRSRGVAMVAPVEVGEGGIDLLISNGPASSQRPAAIEALAPIGTTVEGA